MGTYYALDWIAMGFTFLSMYWIGERRRMGFLVGMVGNVFWFGIMVDSPATLAAKVVIFLRNARGYWRWRD